MGFKDLSEFLTPDLDLPINGKTYAFAPSAQQVLAIKDVYARTYTSEKVDDNEFMVVAVGALGADYDPSTTTVTGREGSVWSQMEADGVSGEQLVRVYNTVALWFGMGHETAERFWESGYPFPKEPEPKPAPKPRARKKGASPQPGDDTTPDQAPTV